MKLFKRLTELKREFSTHFFRASKSTRTDGRVKQSCFKIGVLFVSVLFLEMNEFYLLFKRNKKKEELSYTKTI